MPSSIGLEPESGSALPSFTSNWRAFRMTKQTLSAAMPSSEGSESGLEGSAMASPHVRSVKETRGAGGVFRLPLLPARGETSTYGAGHAAPTRRDHSGRNEL